MEKGELFFVGFPDGIDKEAIDLIKKYRPGGIMLYPTNMEDMDMLQIHMEILYDLMKKEGLKFFISSDHEGGQLETVPGIMPSPGNTSFGKSTKSNIYLYGKYLGKTLKSYGFNTLFAPVVDTFHDESSPVTGLRTFSEDPYKVGEYAKEFIKGLRKEEILGTLKHFPGHGKAISDSHETLPKIYDFDEDDQDLIPFRINIQEGAELIMTAHIIYPHLDKVPATLSKEILTHLLREKMGYEKLIISDAIEMRALYNNYTISEMVEKFFNAGGDMFLIAEARENLQDAYESLERLINNRHINLDNLENSLKRIEEIKKSYVIKDYSLSFLAKVAKEAIKYKVNTKLQSDDSITFLVPKASKLSLADTTNKDISKYEGVIRLFCKDPRIVKYDIFSGELDGPVPPSPHIVSFVVDSFRFKGQQKMQKSLKEKTPNPIYLIIRNPNDEELYKKENYIVTLSTKPISIYYVLKNLFK